MEARPLARTLLSVLPVAAALALASPAGAHRLSAQGSGGCWDGALCFDDFIEGHFAVGVPGVNLDYAYFDTSVSSASGHLFIDAAFSWIEGPTRPATFQYVTDVLEENVVLHRIADGPVTIQATLSLDGGGHITGPDHAVYLSGDLSFGCSGHAQKLFTPTIATDLELTGNSCAQLVGSAIVVTWTYEGNLPSSLLLRAQLQADLGSNLLKGDVLDLGWTGDLSVQITNATAEWDTPSFLTEVPEPSGAGLGLAAIGAIAICGARRQRRSRRVPSYSAMQAR